MNPTTSETICDEARVSNTGGRGMRQPTKRRETCDSLGCHAGFDRCMKVVDALPRDRMDTLMVLLLIVSGMERRTAN